MFAKKNLLLLCFLQLFSCSLYGIFGINMFRAYDINLRPHLWCAEHMQWTSWFEIGYKAHAFNADGNEVNALQVWTPKQDALAMLMGYADASEITQFLVNELGDPQDDGQRGNFIVNGDFKAKGFGLTARYHLPHNLIFGVYVPLYEMQLKNVRFEDQTADVNMMDMLVRENLTSRLAQVVRQFDPSLNLDGWHKLGFGDLYLITEWYRAFPQGKPILKDVTLNARGGLSIPVGVKEDIDDIFSVPFGGDGAVGLLFGGGIILNWFNLFRGGLDVEFIHQFGHTRERRIKIQENQTDFLLLTKAFAHKEYGFTQRFNLFLETCHMFHGLSARATYQFWKSGDDSLNLCNDQFSHDIANNLQSLREWTFHQAIFQLSYDFNCNVPAAQTSYFKPQLSLFYKLPFNGDRSIVLNTVGATLTFNF